MVASLESRIEERRRERDAKRPLRIQRKNAKEKLEKKKKAFERANAKVSDANAARQPKPRSSWQRLKRHKRSSILMLLKAKRECLILLLGTSERGDVVLCLDNQ